MSAGRPHLLRRILRRVQCPWVSVLLLVLLVADAATLPRAPGGTTSTVGRWIGGVRRVPSQRGDLCFAAIDSVVHNPGTPAESRYHILLGRNDFSVSGGGWTHMGFWSLHEERVGFWAPVEHRTSLDFIPGFFSLGTVTPDLRNALADELQKTFPDLSAIFDAALRAGPRAQSTVLWKGHIHNALAITVAALLLLSLGWIPRLEVFQRAKRRAEMGLCVKCGYDLRGSDDSAPCPECGSHPQLDATQGDATATQPDRHPSPP